MIRVVLDTNVYLSAILFGGKCARFRELAREGKIEIFVSEPILAELAGVLQEIPVGEWANYVGFRRNKKFYLSSGSLQEGRYR